MGLGTLWTVNFTPAWSPSSQFYICVVRQREKSRMMVSNPVYEGPIYDTIDDIHRSIPSPPVQTQTPPISKDPSIFDQSKQPTYANSCLSPEKPVIKAHSVRDSENNYTLMKSAGSIVKKSIGDKECCNPEVVRYVNTVSTETSV